MICIPIKKSSTKSLLTALKKAQKHGDIVEIWFDEIKDLNEQNIKQIFKIKTKPFLYKITNSTNKLNKIIEQGIKYIEYIDFDIETPTTVITNTKKNFPKSKIIISYHNFKKTPEDKDLKKLTSKMLRKGADIVKIATFAKDHADSIRVLKLLEGLTKNKQKAICICMGKNGQITRATGHLFGNYLMFAPVSESEKTAKGQYTVAELRKIQNLTN